MNYYPQNPQQPAYPPQGGYAPAPGNQFAGGYGASDDILAAVLPQEDNSGGLGAIPENVYRCRLAEVEAKSTSKGGFAWFTQWEVNDGGPFQGRKLFFVANFLDGQGQISGGIGFAQMMMKALGLPVTGNGAEVQFRKSEILGREANLVVTIQQEGQYRGRNSVERVEPLTTTMPAGAPPQQAQYAPPAYAQPAPGGYAPPPPAAPAPAYAQPPQGFQQPQQSPQWGGAGNGGAPGGAPQAPAGQSDF